MYFNQNNASTYTTSQPNWLTPKIGVHWRRLPMVCPHPHNQLSSNLSEFITKKTGQRRRLKTHLSFTRDGAVPNHQVHWPIWKCLRLSNKTLYPKFITTNKTHTKKKKNKFTKSETVKLKKIKKGVMKSNMGMILSPSFAFLSKTTTSNPSRHCCCLRLITKKYLSEELCFFLAASLLKRTK